MTTSNHDGLLYRDTYIEGWVVVLPLIFNRDSAKNTLNHPLKKYGAPDQVVEINGFMEAESIPFVRKNIHTPQGKFEALIVSGSKPQYGFEPASHVPYLHQPLPEAQPERDLPLNVQKRQDKKKRREEAEQRKADKAARGHIVDPRPKIAIKRGEILMWRTRSGKPFPMLHRFRQ